MLTDRQKAEDNFLKSIFLINISRLLSIKLPPMREQRSITRNIDWITISLYAVMVFFGWINIYAAVYDPETQQSIFDMGLNSGKQLVWIGGALLIIIAILVIDYNFYESFAWIIYGFVMLLLVAVLFFGKEVAGSRSWFDLGGIRLQPAEFGKFATALAVARFFEPKNIKADNLKTLLPLAGIITLPALLIIMQGDTGSALVYAAFVLVFYREGLPSFWVVLGLLLVVLFTITLFLRQTLFYELIAAIGVGGLVAALYFRKKKKLIFLTAFGTVLAIGLVFSVDYIISDIMQPHQRKRLEVLVNPDIDPRGAGWNIIQSKIAIGSGGLAGKGFLKGTQTKFDFVPEQSTDFIFCTVGEEHGLLGSLVVVGLFGALLFRLVHVSERQKRRSARVYGYSVTAILFFHFMVNIGMTIGLFPVIGIPLPFFSYGGSSLWSFTVLLFILIKLDAHRMQMLSR